MATRKPYEIRSDEEKIFDNWTKTLGLLEKGEYSVAVVRAAVALELAMNLAIRAELIQQRQLDSKFVDHLLVWANGLRGKFEKLLMPITKGSGKEKSITALFKRSKSVNDERNSVAHSGYFKSKKVAVRVIEEAHGVISGLLDIYCSNLKLGKTKAEQLTLRSTGTTRKRAAR